MGKIHALASAPPQRSAERQKLADCITRLEQAKAELARLQEAEQRHFEERIAASHTLDTAAATLENLRADEEQIALAEFMGDGTEAEKLRAAHRAVEAAQSRCEQADRVSAALRNRLRAAEENVGVCETSLRSAWLAALTADPAIAALVARFKKIHHELYDLLQVVELTRAAHGFSFHPLDPPRDLDRALLARWQQALDALMHDPDAELPAP
jgi:chromosome segregation ATPase